MEPRYNQLYRLGPNHYHFDPLGPSETRNDFEYNVNTQNSFYPLHDIEGPLGEHGRRVGERLFNPPQYPTSGNSGDLASPGPSNQNYQHWGFHKPNQGTKQSGDQREDPEVENSYELKRKSPNGYST